MKTLLIAGLERIMGIHTDHLQQYLADKGYQVRIVETHSEALTFLNSETVDCLIMEATFALERMHEEHTFVALLPSTLPTVTLGQISKIGYDWIDATYGRTNQEYAHVPFDYEEVLVKARRVMGDVQ